jgi:hypothetical protein
MKKEKKAKKVTTLKARKTPTKASKRPAAKTKHTAGAKAKIAKGKERGFVTYDEILKEFPTIEEDIIFLEELYEKFNAAGVDVLGRRRIT